MKGKKVGIYFLGISVILGLSIFIYNDFLCKSEQCYRLETPIFEPTFFAILGLIPTIIFLLFFSEKIFLEWLKHIAWWFFLVALYFVVDTNPYSSDILSISRTQVALFWMALLFIVTLIYALVMNKSLKSS